MKTRRPDILRNLLAVCMGLVAGLCSAHAMPGTEGPEPLVATDGGWVMADTAKLALPFDESELMVVPTPDNSQPAANTQKLAANTQKPSPTTQQPAAEGISIQKKPDPKRAMWLAMVIPGAGQIYNRKFWKLPIIYGGFLGCAYAMRWNNQQYHDYSKAYLDIMDDDPETQSYNQFLHLNNRINDSNKEQWTKIFKRRKDYYRRYRDMSFFIMVGVYAVSVIDAYVDASLAQFDISDDLSLKVEPAVINSPMMGNSRNMTLNSLQSAGLGLQCSINF